MIGRVLGCSSVKHAVSPLPDKEKQELHDHVIALAADQQRPMLEQQVMKKLGQLSQLEPLDIDVLGNLSDPCMPAALYACAHERGVLPPLIDVYPDWVHKNFHRGFEAVQDALTEGATIGDEVRDDATEITSQVLKSPLLFGIERLSSNQRECRLTVDELIQPAKDSPSRHVGDRVLLGSGLVQDERQTARQRNLFAVHVGGQLARCSTQLDPPVVTRSTALGQVGVIMDDHGAIKRVEHRAPHNFVFDKQALKDGKHHFYEGEADQNAAAWFCNDSSMEPEGTKKHADNLKKNVDTMLKNVAEMWQLSDVELLEQPEEYHHSTALDTFGIGLLLLQLLTAAVIPGPGKSSAQLIKFWAEYKEVSYSEPKRRAQTSCAQQLMSFASRVCRTIRN